MSVSSPMNGAFCPAGRDFPYFLSKLVHGPGRPRLVTSDPFIVFTKQIKDGEQALARRAIPERFVPPEDFKQLLHCPS